MTVGERIKAAREKANLTQAQLAEKCGVATITIQQYERDKREPDIDRLLNLSKQLNVSIEYLLGVIDENGFLTPEGFGDSEDYEFVKVLGLDDPRNRRKIKRANSPKTLVMAAMDRLNPAGQQKAVERVEELTEIPKYKKEPPQD